ncbi:hypothetical protein EPN81_00705 [Patescibacteria group bacterium]|nr:MAG: hypothetical protein EPN81_00705 [Patescibacteria group bacterium]
MKLERLALYVTFGLLTIVFLRFPVMGVIALERKLDAYPIVSQETIATIDEFGGALEDFDAACAMYQDWLQDAQRFDIGTCEYEASYRTCPYDGYEACLQWGLDNPIEPCTDRLVEIEKKVDQAANEMYAAVERRKTIAARADLNLLKSMVLGTQTYTHSKWLCAPPYATFTTQISLGFTPTYERPKKLLGHSTHL